MKKLFGLVLVVALCAASFVLGNYLNRDALDIMDYLEEEGYIVQALVDEEDYESIFDDDMGVDLECMNCAFVVYDPEEIYTGDGYGWFFYCNSSEDADKVYAALDEYFDKLYESLGKEPRYVVLKNDRVVFYGTEEIFNVAEECMGIENYVDFGIFQIK